MEEKDIKKNENPELLQKSPEQAKLSETWIEDSKEEMEDYLEEHGVYLRQ